MPQTAPTPTVPSPCVNVCRMDPQTGLCEGCWRTLDEIAGWSKMTDAGKREVWLSLAERGGPLWMEPADGAHPRSQPG